MTNMNILPVVSVETITEMVAGGDESAKDLLRRFKTEQPNLRMFIQPNKDQDSDVAAAMLAGMSFGLRAVELEMTKYVLGKLSLSNKFAGLVLTEEQKACLKELWNERLKEHQANAEEREVS